MYRKIFLSRHNLAPMFMIWDKKTGEKWAVAPKNRGIFATCNLGKFIFPKFNPVLDFSPRGSDRRPFLYQLLTIFFRFSDHKNGGESPWGEGERSLGEHKVRHGKNIHLIDNWFKSSGVRTAHPTLIFKEEDGAQGAPYTAWVQRL